MGHSQLGGGEDLDRLAGALDHLVAGGEKRPHAERFADRLGRAEAPRDLEILLDKLDRPLALPEASGSERSVRAPHQRHRVDVEELQRPPAGLLEVDQSRARITHRQ